MLRVTCELHIAEQVSDIIPKQLRSTRNLGKLDIQVLPAGKYNAIRWLLKHRFCPTEVVEGDAPFAYMGDDDNDLESLNRAALSLVVLPTCSPEVQRWIDSIKQATMIESISIDHNLGLMMCISKERRQTIVFADAESTGMTLTPLQSTRALLQYLLCAVDPPSGTREESCEMDG